MSRPCGATTCGGPTTASTRSTDSVSTSRRPSGATSPTSHRSNRRRGHDGRGGCFAFVDWWADENELHHHIFTGPKDAPHEITPVGDDDLTACVWDLALMAFERRAWVDTVLANRDGPDVDAYLAQHLDELV